MAGDAQGPDGRRPATPVLEIVSSAIGSLMALGLIGWLVWDGLTGSTAPPDIVVEVGAARRGAETWMAPVRAVNRGGETAAAVRVRAELTVGDAPPEVGETEFDFVPGRSTREGTLVFRRDPSSGRLDVHVTGWREP